ncbi:amidohydrolase [Rhodobacteraceae bacterium CCMM004]|nr:amidohydrolase [Rhodobacteraceae bacterium CCMM004]
MRIAAAAYPVDWHDSPASYEDKLALWVAMAAGQGADLLVFPEYAGIEASLIGPPREAPQPHGWAEAAASAADLWIGPMAALAAEHGVHILAGSGPWTAEGGRIVNRAHLICPDGRRGWQDKQILTPWERRETPLSPGEGLSAFDTDLGRIAILICYDSEFPLLARALPCDILLVPSCTDSFAGFTRVQVAARARALEGQCVSVQAATVGATALCPYLDENAGGGGIYGPPDTGFEASGILAEGVVDQPGWTYADVDVAALPDYRGAAQVAVAEHWDEQLDRVQSILHRPLDHIEP